MLRMIMRTANEEAYNLLLEQVRLTAVSDMKLETDKPNLSFTIIAGKQIPLINIWHPVEITTEIYKNHKIDYMAEIIYKCDNDTTRRFIINYIEWQLNHNMYYNLGMIKVEINKDNIVITFASDTDVFPYILFTYM